MRLLDIQRKNKNENYLNYLTENQLYVFGHGGFHSEYKDGEKNQTTNFRIG